MALGATIVSRAASIGFLRLATLALAQAIDLATFSMMVARHGAAAEANPLVNDLFVTLGMPAVITRQGRPRPPRLCAVPRRRGARWPGRLGADRRGAARDRDRRGADRRHHQHGGPARLNRAASASGQLAGGGTSRLGDILPPPSDGPAIGFVGEAPSGPEVGPATGRSVVGSRRSTGRCSRPAGRPGGASRRRP